MATQPKQRDLLSRMVARVWQSHQDGSRGPIQGHASWAGSFVLAALQSFPSIAEAGAQTGESFWIDFPGSAEGPTRARVIAADPKIGFVVLMRENSAALGLDLPILVEPPPEGATARTAFCPSGSSNLQHFYGEVESVGSTSFVIEIGGLSSFPWECAGAPVVTDGNFAGILIDEATSSGRTKLTVLSVAAMARSEATDVVRQLTEPARMRAGHEGIGIVPQRASGDGITANREGPEGASTEDLSAGRKEQPLDSAAFARLSPSSRGALERANGMRTGAGLSEVHMEQLIVGLFEKYGGPTQRLLQRAGIDEAKLLELIRDVRDTKIPTSYPSVKLRDFPPFSDHARRAIQAGVQRSLEQKAKEIRSRHLLYGALSVDECGLIKALQERGVLKEDIYTVMSDDPDRSASVAGSGTEVPQRRISDPPLRRKVERVPPENKEPVELIRRQLGAINEVVGELRSAMDAVSLRHGRRQTLRLEFHDPSLAPMFLEDLLDQVVKFAKEDGPRLLGVSGSSSLPDTFLATLEPLKTLVEHAHHPVNIDHLPAGFKTDRVQRLFDDLRDELAALVNVLEAASSELDEAGPENDAAEVSGEEGDRSGPLPVDVDGLAPGANFPGHAAESASAAPTPKVDSDLWSTKDCLGYEAYARTIADLITHKDTVAPLTIGIKAPWGAGKTSLMKRVQHLLDGYAELSEQSRTGILQHVLSPQLTLREMLGELKNSTKPMGLKLRPGKDYKIPSRITVWFNAWKYQTSEQVWAGMAHCIISQVTARMDVRDREMFWLRLHARRVNADQVRRKVYEAVAQQVLPTALVLLVICALVVWVTAAIPVAPWKYWVQGATVLTGLFGVIWKAWEKLGDKAAATVKELVREPVYEGKLGYLHLVESDIREVLDLVTEAQEDTRAEAPVRLGSDAALKGRSSTVDRGLGAQPPASVNSGAELRSAGQPGAAVPTSASTSTKSEAAEKKAPLVVFVDDLDRCAPNKVAEVVEAINLFLCGDYPNCIFVLGMEPGMVAAALEVANKDVIQKALEMGLVDGTAPVGWRFMEKIVQLPITIPPPTALGRKSYVESLTGVAAWNSQMAQETVGIIKEVAQAQATPPPPPAEEDVAQFMEQLQAKSLREVEEKSERVVAAAPVEKRRAAVEASKRVYAQTFNERDPSIADFVREVAELVDGNPRQIKRYVNVFRFYSTLRYGLRIDGAVPASDLPSDKVLAKFVALSIQWPHAVDCLRAKTDGAISRLEFLEAASAKIDGGNGSTDEEWKKIVASGGVGAWAQTGAFREFLKRGESLGRSRGHGLW